MARYVYINITANHFKVWGFDLFSCNDGTGQSISYWGRIGLSMQRLNKKEKLFGSFGDAHDYIKSKIDEKLCKGYRGFPNWIYFQMIQSPRGIAALIEKISNMGISETYWKNPKRKNS